MPLWLSQLLAEPALGLQLVAGSSGLRRRGPVRWTHISELPDPTPWLEGGEILLTTGLGIRDDEALQRRLVAGLDEAGCAGIGFGVGVVLGAVPPALVDEAERRGVPLFTVPFEVPFIAVTKHVSRAVFDEHYATLRSAVELHRNVLAAVLADQGLAGVFATFRRPLAEHTAILFDYYGRVLARHDVGEAVDAREVWTTIVAGRGHTERVQIDFDGRILVGSAVRLGDQVEAVVALLGDRPLHDHEVLLLEQGLAGLSLELARGLSVREARRTRVDELLDEVAAGTMGARPVRRALARLGLDVDGSYEVVAVRRSASLPERVLCSIVEDVIAGAGQHPVVGRHEDSVIALLHPSGAGIAERIADALQLRGWRDIAIGRSRARQDIAELRVGLREAALAVALPGKPGVRDITALGLPGLLATLEGAAGSDAFVSEVLGAVVAYDASEGSQLVGSLRAYLRHGCRPGPAAAELCIHRHTLTYRLERIAELTGRDPRDGAHLLAFSLALELHGHGADRPSSGIDERRTGGRSPAR